MIEQAGASNEAILITVGGAVLAFLQAMILFVVSDLKERIVRIENKYIGAAQAGD